MGKAIEEFTNSVAGAAGTGLTGALLAPIGQQIGYGLGTLTGYNKALERDQLRQQQALTDIQSDANLGLMKESYAQQKALWEATNAPAEVAKLKEAGLNPALMYKGAGMGSTGGGSASVGGGQASDTASRMNALNMQTGMGLSMMKLQSEIDLNKATAEKLRAEARTQDETRTGLIEKLKQDGRGLWLDNVRKKYELTWNGEKDRATKFVNPVTNEELEIGEYFDDQMNADLLQTLSDSDIKAAQALLTNEKAKGYWKELLNDTVRANAAEIQSSAYKLSQEWQTGEFTNWKTWAEMAQIVVGDVLRGIGNFKSGNLPPSKVETVIKGKNGWSRSTDYYK